MKKNRVLTLFCYRFLFIFALTASWGLFGRPTPAQTANIESVCALSQSAYETARDQSWLFYLAQRSGETTVANMNTPVAWRVDSAVTDGTDIGADLTGGWYVDGGHVKFTFPMASAVTMLAWGVAESPTPPSQSTLDNLQWATDYLLKTVLYDNPHQFEMVAMVGDPITDRVNWTSPELMEIERPTHTITNSCSGSDIAGETAAALASASIVFRDAGELDYAEQLLTTARATYAFAEQYPGNYTGCVDDVGFYASSGYVDELMWGAMWLYRAERAAETVNTAYYLQAATMLHDQLAGGSGWAHDWDNKVPGAYILLADATADQKYKDEAEQWLNYWLPNQGILYSPDGMACLSSTHALGYSSTMAFLAFAYSDVLREQNGDEWLAYQYAQFGASQIDYILGENDDNMSYMVGFGELSPRNPHHRGAHSSATGTISAPIDNAYQLTGALVSGPSQCDDKHDDSRTNAIENRVALDYNSGLTAALTIMAAQCNVPSNLLPTEPPTPINISNIVSAETVVSGEPISYTFSVGNAQPETRTYQVVNHFSPYVTLPKCQHDVVFGSTPYAVTDGMLNTTFTLLPDGQRQLVCGGKVNYTAGLDFTINPAILVGDIGETAAFTVTLVNSGSITMTDVTVQSEHCSMASFTLGIGVMGVVPCQTTITATSEPLLIRATGEPESLINRLEVFDTDMPTIRRSRTTKTLLTPISNTANLQMQGNDVDYSYPVPLAVTVVDAAAQGKTSTMSLIVFGVVAAWGAIPALLKKQAKASY